MDDGCRYTEVRKFYVEGSVELLFGRQWIS